MRNKNKYGTGAAVGAALLLLFAPAARALPEGVGEWRSDHEDVTPFVLSAGSEDVGRWTRRVYTRESPRRSVEANLMEGPGPGPLRVPEAASSSDAVLEAQSEYRVLEVAGRRAVLERSSLLPPALAVPVGRDGTLTLEGRVGEEELIELAEQLVEIINEGE